MTSTNLSQKQLNYAQISIVCVDILKQCLIDILHIHIKPTDLGKEIRLSPSLTAGKDKLSSEQKDLCCPLSPGVPDYGKFDVTLLYKLIRNLCPKLKPSKEWGKVPDTADQKIGDDIERIRLFRNKHYAHPNSAEITESDFTELWNEGKSLINRIQIFTTARGCKTDYGLKLTNISGRMIKYEEYTSYVNLFRAIYIERNVEVTCGDTAHFKADIRLEESAFLSVSWERVDGSATNHIDISCEKYKGSTSRQLNIHSVCKEDEGEYQAVISRNIDHKIFSNIGFLRTQGELPRLDNLKVSTTKEEICIHYSHTVLENSPRVTDIEWTKNKTPLDLTDHKYCGGGLENSCLTISCPTKEDGGEYSCTVTNAVGSVSRVVILEEPSAKISTNTPVVHGSETRFSCLISSCPSSEEIEWQKSCDGNTFYPIDINELKYHGSNEDPSSPVLCLPKTTFDDQQFYRIAVRNKIGECMSSTHFLEVVGNRPNITNAICTTKDRSVRLNCDVFLYDKSPPLQEVYWTKNEHRLDVHGSGGKYSGRVSPDDRSLTINNVNKHDAGNYQLTAINSVGPTYSDVIVLGVPDVVLKKKYKNEDGSQCFMITIKSNPAPFFVQWSMKDKKSGTLQQININADEYKGTSNSFPRPMLVVKHKETLENYRFRIEVENVIGFTEKVIPDETSPIPLKSDDNTVNVGNLNRVYEKRGRNIRFGKVFDELAEKFPEAKIGRLKDLIQNSCEVEDVRSLKQAKSARDCFRILRSENIFTPEDVICLQYLLKMTECEELERKCIEYAKMQKALYYYEKPPDNGYMNVHFHIVANIRGYGTENITKVRETVAAIVGCTIEEVLVNGYLPSASFILVLSIKNNLVNKLLALKRKDEDKLSKLSIDYFKIGGTTIRLEFLRDQDEHTTVYPYPESSGLSEMPYFSDYDFMESGSDQDEHTTVYPYPESSGLSEMPYFSDYDFMESVYEKCDVELLERRENEIMFTETKEFQAMYENVRNQVQAVVNDPGKAAMGIKARLKHQKDGQRDFIEDDEEDDNDENKASDFVSFRTVSDVTSDIESDYDASPDFESDSESERQDAHVNSMGNAEDEVGKLLAEFNESKVYTVRKEVYTPHKLLLGVDFDPAWDKKIAGGNNARQDDFLAEEVASCSDSESEREDDKTTRLNPVDACTAKMTLSRDITIEYPDNYHVDPTRAITWSQEKRADELRDTTLRFMEKMCTDIYTLVDKRDKKKVLVFDQSDEALVTFSVKVNKDEKEDGYRYEARIKNKSNWVTRVAHCEGDEIKFHATEIESFYIIKIPQKEKEIIKPEGNTLSFKHSKKVSLDMPSQTVDTPQQIDLQLSNVDKRAMVKRHSLFPEKFKLQKISQRLFVEHGIDKFNKAFSVKLDLESFRDNTDAGTLEPVAILWDGEEPTIKPKTECSLSYEANRVVMTMKNLPNKSGLSVGLVAPGIVDNDEVKLAYADVFLCNITIHIKVVNPQEAMLYINCVMIENLSTFLKQNQSLDLIGTSEDFYLKNFHRIRAHLSGNSERKKSRKQNKLDCFIVFSNRAKENCLSFTILKQTRLGGSPTTVLEFSLDSGPKKKIHRQEFDPWMLIGKKPGCLDKNPAVRLSRGLTFDDFKSPRPF